MATITTVHVSKPAWIQSETYTDRGLYYAVSLFGVGKDTVCLRGQGERLDPEVVLEGVRYGLYECLVEKAEEPVKKSSRFVDKEDMFGSSVMVAGVVAGILLVLGARK